MTLSRDIQIADYLRAAVEERFLPMTRELAKVFTPPIHTVDTYIQQARQPPFGWIFPTLEAATINERGTGDELQVFPETLRIVLAHQGDGWDGKSAHYVRIWKPTVMNYFKARRFLIHKQGQDVPRYFHHLEFTGATEIDEGDPSGHVGIDFGFNFVFSIPSVYYPGNQ